MEDFSIDTGLGKQQKYNLLLAKAAAFTTYETDLIANMANIAAILHDAFDNLWTGFYRVVGSELVLGPFQGPLACTRIAFGKGVCGHAWKEGRTIVVDDVDKFPGHIACSSLSKSEIVVPIRHHSEIIGVLDIDNTSVGAFDHLDSLMLEKIAALLHP